MSPCLVSQCDPCSCLVTVPDSMLDIVPDPCAADEKDGQAGRKAKQKEQRVESTKPGFSKAEMIAEAGAITPLVNLLNGNRGQEAQEEAAGALWALADHARNRVAITEAGGIGPLVMLLGCQNAKARQHAELALVRLSIEGANRVIIIEKLVGMLHDDRGTAAQEQAAAALANLARESADNRTSILKADGIPRLLHLLHSTSSKAKENSASAISQLAHKSIENQKAIADANGIPKLVTTLVSASANVKELSGVKLCTLIAECIWRMADGNKDNQTSLMKEGAIPPVVAMVTNPDPEMQTNAAGSLACLSRDHPENQAAVARSGAIPPLCSMVRDGTPETREESAAALWALATDNATNKATIAKLGGIEPLVNMLMYAQSEKSSINAAGALAALAAQHSDNRLTITKRMVTVLGGKAPPARAVRLLSALASLCDNEPTNQVAIAKSGGVQHLITWLGNTSEDVQVQAARAMLAVSSNNSTTQSLVGKLGGIPPLVMLIQRGTLEAQENAACALWHLATLKENRALIKDANGITPVVGMLISESKHGPQLSAMLLVRLAEGSTRAAVEIADAAGIAPLVRLLSNGTAATQQMAAAALAAIAKISQCRDRIANAGAIKPLVKLIGSNTLGTPETAARVLSFLAKNDLDSENISEADANELADVQRDGPTETAEVEQGKAAVDAESIAGARESESDEEYESMEIIGGEARRLCVKDAGGVQELVNMLDGSNLAVHRDTPLKPATVGGWAAMRVGVAGAVETAAIFMGSQVDFGVRIGMQEQAAAALADLAADDVELQDAIIEAGAALPLLSLAQFGSPLAQEYSAQCIWYLATTIENQHTLVEHNCIVDLVNLVKGGSPVAQEMAAAGLGQLAQGYIVEMKGILARKPASRDRPSAAKSSGSPVLAPEETACATSSLGGDEVSGDSVNSNRTAHSKAEEQAGAAAAAGPDGTSDATTVVAPEATTNPGVVSDNKKMAETPATLPTSRDGEAMVVTEDASDESTLHAIARCDGISPLIKLAESGTPGGKEKAAAALWHLALDPDNQELIASKDGIKPLVGLLADGNEAAQHHASDALTRLATNHAENQAQIAKRLVGLLDHDDAMVVSRAAHDLQSLAHDHPGAPVVIVNAGAISPLVTVLSNGKTDEGRNEAAKTLATLANSGPANQLAIAIGLVALLGVGTDQAQEYVTALLLDLTSGSGNLHNRKAIANAGPFRMLVQQLRSESPKVKLLAAAVMAKLSGDSEENIQAIAASKGIPPLVALLDAEEAETQSHAAVVLADMTRGDVKHATDVASEGGVPLLVALLTKSHDLDTKAEAAGALGSVAEGHAQKVGSAGAIAPLVEMLKTDSNFAKTSASRALARIGAGGKENQDTISSVGGIPLLIALLTASSVQKEKLASDPPAEDAAEGEVGEGVPRVADWEVQASAAEALGELSNSNPAIQASVASNVGIEPLIALVTHGSQHAPKEQAAFALWRLSTRCPANQKLIANADGICELVNVIGSAMDKGQLMTAEALASLALGNVENQSTIAKLLVGLLRGSSPEDDEREKAARAISRFARAHASNQDAIASAGGINLIVSLLEPHKWDPPKPGDKSKKGNTKEEEEDPPDVEEVEVLSESRHYRVQNELASALWSLSIDNVANQVSIAHEQGLRQLIALMNDRPEIHRNAAGALWSLASDAENQKRIAEDGGIPHLVELLTSGRKMGTFAGAEETAAGALRSLARREANRDLIAEAGGISLLVPLFDGGSEMVKSEVTGALLTLVTDNPANQFTIASKLVSMLAAAPDASEASNVAAFARVEASEHATNVIYQLTLDRDNKDALSRTPVILNLVRLLKGGSDKAQKMSADALTQIARMSAELCIQVTQQLVTLLSSTNADVRKRAGRVLHGMNDNSSEDSKRQKEAAMAGGVAPLVELLKDGLKNQRIEAQEYAVWSMSMTADRKRGQLMVRAGCIRPLIESLNSGDLSLAGQECAAIVLSCLALDRACHGEVINEGGIAPLVRLLTAETLGAKKHSATGLARMALGNPETQALIAQAGALKPLVHWLVSSRGQSTLKGEAQVGSADNVERGSLSPSEGTKAAAKSTSPTGSTTTRRMSHDGRLSHEDLAARRVSHEDLAARRASREEIPKASAPEPPIPRELAPVAALALADLARDNLELQTLISEAGAMEPLIAMLTDFQDADGQKAACSALATLAQGSNDNQITISKAGGIPPLVELIKSNRVASHENATRALSMLAMDDGNKAQIAETGGVEPLVGLLSTGNELTKQHAAKALESLAHECTENQVTLANCKASEPLIKLLASDSDATADSALAAVLCLAEHAPSQKLVIRRLVEVLHGKSTSAQLKAAQALASLSSRNVNHRQVIVKSGAIEPLVGLMGNGSRSDKNTPPERAAAVLSDLARLVETKTDLARAGGILPLVTMLSSGCEDARKNAACALFHLSMNADNKTAIASSGGIQRLVSVLAAGNVEAVRHAAGTLWQLASSSDNKNAIAAANGIPPLVAVLLLSDEKSSEEADEHLSAPTPRRSGAVMLNENMVALAKETAAAVLSELARSQSSFRVEIAKAGGIAPLIELMNSEAQGAQKQATCAIWGLTMESKYRVKVGSAPGAVGRLVELLRMDEGETQGYAAATLVNLANDERGKKEIVAVGGAGPLITIGLGPDSWLRQQCVQCLKMLGYSDPREAAAKKSGASPPMSPRLAKFQAKLAANPDLWMMTEAEHKPHQIINEEHMADIAARFSLGARVIVDPGERKAAVMYIGKIEEIAPGYWVGVMYDEPMGKNDGSIKGRRYFECPHDHGGFLRPDHISVDANPPPPRVKKEAEAPATEAGEEGSKVERRNKRSHPMAKPIPADDVVQDAEETRMPPGGSEAMPLPASVQNLVEAKGEVKAEAKAELKAEPKADSKAEPKVDPSDTSANRLPTRGATPRAAQRKTPLGAKKIERGSAASSNGAASTPKAVKSVSELTVEPAQAPSLAQKVEPAGAGARTSSGSGSARKATGPGTGTGAVKLAIAGNGKATPLRHASPRSSSSPRQVSPRVGAGACSARAPVSLPSDRPLSGKGAKTSRKSH